MVELSPQRRAEFLRFLEAQRASCLWYTRTDWVPATRDEMLRALDAIQKHGDRAAFVRAGEMRLWLSPPSNAGSAGS